MNESKEVASWLYLFKTYTVNDKTALHHQNCFLLYCKPCCFYFIV